MSKDPDGYDHGVGEGGSGYAEDEHPLPSTGQIGHRAVSAVYSFPPLLSARRRTIITDQVRVPFSVPQSGDYSIQLRIRVDASVTSFSGGFAGADVAEALSRLYFYVNGANDEESEVFLVSYKESPQDELADVEWILFQQLLSPIVGLLGDIALFFDDLRGLIDPAFQLPQQTLVLSVGAHRLTVGSTYEFVVGVESDVVTQAFNVLGGQGIEVISQPQIQEFVLDGPAPTSIVVDIIDASPNPADPYAKVHLAGRATYTSGSPIQSGTATITAGSSQWTAPITNGDFSRDVHAPAASANVCVQATDGTLVGQDCIWLQVHGSSGGGCYTLGASTTSRDVENGYPWLPIDERDCFGRNDAEMNAWLELNDVSCSGIRARMYWIRPDGSQQGDPITTQWDYPPPEGWEWWRASTYWTVAGTDILNYPGKWSIRIYVDDSGGLDRVATEDLVLRYDLAEHRTCRSVLPNDPWDCMNPTNVFYQTDARAYTWAKLDKVSEALNVKWEFSQPNGSLYATFQDSGDPPNGPCWPWYKTWGWIDVAGALAAQKCGLWGVKVYIQSPFGQWQPIYTDSFLLLESPPSSPTVTVAAQPPQLFEGDLLTLHVTASDNTYLQRVQLNWYDGSWHNVTLRDGILASSYSQAFALGEFSPGQELVYFATATDTSGTFHSSPTGVVRVQSRPCCLSSGDCAPAAISSCVGEGGTVAASCEECPGVCGEEQKCVPGPSCVGDSDSDFDLFDHKLVVSCMLGPGTPVGNGCSCADLRFDTAIDLLDFAIIQQLFGTENAQRCATSCDLPEGGTGASNSCCAGQVVGTDCAAGPGQPMCSQAYTIQKCTVSRRCANGLAVCGCQQ